MTEKLAIKTQGVAQDVVQTYHGQEIEVVDDVKAKTISDDLKFVKHCIKKIEDERKDLTRPIDQSKTNIMGRFDEILEPLKDLKNRMSNPLKTYLITQRDQKHNMLCESIQTQISNLRTQHNDVAVQALVNDSELAVHDSNSINTQVLELERELQELNTKTGYNMKGKGSLSVIKSKKKFRVLDIKKIPHQFLQVNRVELERYIKEMDEFRGGTWEDMGIEVYEETTLETR
jgi:uncharacterized protein YqgV (UPF0045/DUF77 family)